MTKSSKKVYYILKSRAIYYPVKKWRFTRTKAIYQYLKEKEL